MKRRDLLLFAALGLLSFAASATLLHATDKVWRLGVLSLVNNPAMHNAALSQLAERGFVQGRNLVVDTRVGTAEQMPALARELVIDGPDVIMAVSDWALSLAASA